MSIALIVVLAVAWCLMRKEESRIAGGKRGAGALTLVIAVFGALPAARADVMATDDGSIVFSELTSNSLLYVTTTADSNDGVCDSQCSLRDAILEANANEGMDVISVPPGHYLLTLDGEGEDFGGVGDLDITDAVFIGGTDPATTIIDASQIADRAIDIISPGGIVTLVGLTVTGGHSGLGGGIRHYEGDLYLSDVVVTLNQALAGGGVHSENGELTIQNGSVIVGNLATGSQECVGGGVCVYSGSVSVSDSTIADNQAEYSGGGLFFWNTDGSISGSTISGNSAPGGGGLSISDSCSIELVNSTLSGNSALSYGGGVQLMGGADLTLHSVTISDNSAPDASAIYAPSVVSEVNFVNNLIGGSCAIDASVILNGGNVESGTSCGFTGVGDHDGVGDLRLGWLGDFGGPTMTMLPGSDSPAVGNGSDTYCLNLDQRGEPRDGMCDAGAVERQVDDPDPLFMDNFETGSTGRWSSAE